MMSVETEDRESSSQSVKVQELPDGWVKRIIQRRSGATKGHWDVYLIPPGRHHRQLRSTVELMKFIQNYPNVPVNPTYVNFERSFEPLKEGNNLTRICHTLKLMKDWKTGDPKPSNSSLMIIEKKKARAVKVPVHKKVEEKEKLSKANVDYLNRVYAKVSHPSSDQIVKLALESTGSPLVVQSWFTDRVKEDTSRLKPIRLLDITGAGMPDPDCQHDQEQYGEEYMIELDNAEADAYL